MSARNVNVLLVAILLIVAFGFAFYDLGISSFKERGRNTLIIPLYSSPSYSWREILAIHQQYKNVLIDIIINPDNGPGNSYNLSYAKWIGEFRLAGINVLGYVYTSYGKRPIPFVESDIRNYTEWYHLKGIFLDEVSDQSSYESYYCKIVNYSESVGLNYIIGNPGTYVPLGYIHVFNSTVIYENPGYPSISSLRSYGENISRDKLAIISYGVPFSSTTIQAIAGIAQTMYFTNWNGSDPYENVSSYLPQIAQLLN